MNNCLDDIAPFHLGFGGITFGGFFLLFPYKISVATTFIGIELCKGPQSSEHCPKRVQGKAIFVLVELMRPGIASIFKPAEGRAKACKTSEEVIKNLVASFNSQYN